MKKAIRKNRLFCLRLKVYSLKFGLKFGVGLEQTINQP